MNRKRKHPTHSELNRLPQHPTPVISEEPDLQPHTIELPKGMSVVIGADACTIVRDTGYGFVDLGESPILGVLVGWVQEQLEEAQRMKQIGVLGEKPPNLTALKCEF